MYYDTKVWTDLVMKCFGRDYYHAHLSKVQQSPEVVESVKNWLSQRKNIMFFGGNTGLGKTYLAAAICNSLIEEKRQFRCFDEKSFFAHLRSKISNGIDAEYEIKRLCEIEYFILDDIGSAMNLNEWQSEQLFSFLDQRAASRKPTMITSNLFLNDLEKKFTPRFVSRMKDHRNTILEEIGADKRITGV